MEGCQSRQTRPLKLVAKIFYFIFKYPRGLKTTVRHWKMLEISSSVDVWAKVPWIATVLNLWIRTDRRWNRKAFSWWSFKHLRNAPSKVAEEFQTSVIDRSPKFQRQLVWKCMTAPAARTWPPSSHLPRLLSTLMSLSDRTVPVCLWRWRPKLRICRSSKASM